MDAFSFSQKVKLPNQSKSGTFLPLSKLKISKTRFCPPLLQALPFSVLLPLSTCTHSLICPSYRSSDAHYSSRPPCSSHSPETTASSSESFPKTHALPATPPTTDHLSLSPPTLPWHLVCTSTGKYHFIMEWFGYSSTFTIDCDFPAGKSLFHCFIPSAWHTVLNWIDALLQLVNELTSTYSLTRIG